MPQEARTDGNNNIFVQVEGDRNQVNIKGLAHLTLTRYLTRRSVENDADILTPYSFSIPMIGRDDDLAALGDWLEGPKPISVRVMTGRAGAGKTRLALELIEARVKAGWDAGVVTSRELDRFFAQQNLKSWGWQHPTLVVIDYAASHAEAIYGWLAELSDHGGVDGKPLRLLLLERSANQEAGWWRTAFGYADGTAKAIQRLIDPPEPIALPPIDERESKRRIFQAALESGENGLDAPAAGEDAYFDHQLDNLTWGGEPLFLMMAGLLAAKHGVRQVLALARTDLAFDLAERELERIGRAGGDNASRVTFLRHMAAYVTLCYGLSRTALEEAIEEERQALRRDASGDAAGLADLLIDALPSAAHEAAPILPDMIGEAACLLALGDGSDVVLRAFERERTQVPATAIRAAQDFAGQERNGKEISAPLTWMDALIERNLVDVDQLMLIANQLPHTSWALVEHHARLLKEIGRIMRRRVEDGDTNALSLLAGSLNNLATILGDLGRREDALEVAEETVSLRRRLASERPDAFIPDLAASLNNLAPILSALGRREDALEAAEEAVSLGRRLASERPDVFEPYLAVSLMTYANILDVAGPSRESLERNVEAIRIYLPLYLGLPSAFDQRMIAMTKEYIQAAFAGVEKLAALVKGKLTGAAAVEAVSDLVAKPEDERRQGSLVVQLEKALEADPAFAEELRALVEDVKKEGGDQVAQMMTVTGDNNKSAQVTGSGNNVNM